MNKIPFYRSPVFTAAVAAFFAQLAGVADWPALVQQVLSGEAGALSRVAGLLLTAAVVAWRAASRVQPLTLTGAGAAAQNAEEARTIAPQNGQSGRAMPLVLLLIAVAATVGAPLGVAGCSALGLAQPRTFQQGYAYGLAQIEALNNAARIELDAGRLPVKSAEYVLALTRQSRGYLEAARALHGTGDATGARTQAELAIAVLTQLQTFLNQGGE